MTRGPVLVDSGIWIDHINGGDDQLVSLLRRRKVRLHPMIVAEIALGSITQRDKVLEELRKLPAVSTASHAEIMAMIEWQKLWSTGVGYVDTHLLASTCQTEGCRIWTRDKRLHAQAERLAVAYTP